MTTKTQATNTQAIFERIGGHRLVPVIAIDSVDAALPLADALLEGGLPLAEITFRTAAAAEVIALLTQKRPELLVGAGTILNGASLDQAISAGAAFGVSPGTNPAVVQAAAGRGLPFIPGVVTPSEIEQALALGSRLMKFFPAEASGGAAMLKAVIAPYVHTGVKFMPTGGVTLSNIEAYLALDCVAAIGGTWLATKEDIAEKRWGQITQKCREARQRIGQ